MDHAHIIDPVMQKMHHLQSRIHYLEEHLKIKNPDTETHKDIDDNFVI